LRRLIINADDFGFTRDVNTGIVEAHRNGVLTSTTLMANGDAFDHAVQLARETPSLDIGCHLVLVQGRSLVTGRELPASPGGVIAALVARHLDVYGELRAQVEKILGAGIRPTHLDSHKHTHIVPAIFRQIVRLAEEFKIPYVRRLPFARIYLGSRANIRMTDHFLGYRLTGSLTEHSFARALSSLRDGTTEFMCHPGYLGPELAAAPTRLKQSRVRELEALTSPRIRDLIASEGIQLLNFPSLED
jgi:chitin disaccharide deacetylase